MKTPSIKSVLSGCFSQYSTWLLDLDLYLSFVQLKDRTYQVIDIKAQILKAQSETNHHSGICKRHSSGDF